MQIDVSTFRGEAPKMAPRLLPNEMAKLANNSRLLSGDLGTWYGFVESTTQTIASTPATIYYLDDQLWLSFYSNAPVSLTNLYYVTDPSLPFYTGGSLGNYTSADVPIITGLSSGQLRVADTNCWAFTPTHGDGLAWLINDATGSVVGNVAQDSYEAAIPSGYFGPQFGGGGIVAMTGANGSWVVNYQSPLSGGSGWPTQGGSSTGAWGLYVCANPAGTALYDIMPLLQWPTINNPNSFIAFPCSDFQHLAVLCGSANAANNGYNYVLNIISFTSAGAPTVVSTSTCSQLDSTATYLYKIWSPTGGYYPYFLPGGGNQYCPNNGGSDLLGYLEASLNRVWICGVNSPHPFTCLQVVGSTFSEAFAYNSALRPFPGLPDGSPVVMSVFAQAGICYFVGGTGVSAWDLFPSTAGTVMIQYPNVEVDVAKANIGGDTSFRTYFCGCDVPRFTDLGLASGLLVGGNPVTGSASIGSSAGPYPVYSRKLGVPNPTIPISIVATTTTIPATATAASYQVTTSPNFSPAPGFTLLTNVNETFDNPQQWNLPANGGNTLSAFQVTGGSPGANLQVQSIAEVWASAWKSFASLDWTQPITFDLDMQQLVGSNLFQAFGQQAFYIDCDATLSGTAFVIIYGGPGHGDFITYYFASVSNGVIGAALNTPVTQTPTNYPAVGSYPGWQGAGGSFSSPWGTNWWHLSFVITPGSPTTDANITVTAKYGAVSGPAYQTVPSLAPTVAFTALHTLFTMTISGDVAPIAGPGFGVGTWATTAGYPNWFGIKVDNFDLTGTSTAQTSNALEATTYLYTLVNDLGEESGPCPAMVTSDGTGTITVPIGSVVNIPLPGSLAAAGVDPTYFQISNGYQPTIQLGSVDFVLTALTQTGIGGTAPNNVYQYTGTVASTSGLEAGACVMVYNGSSSGSPGAGWIIGILSPTQVSFYSTEALTANSVIATGPSPSMNLYRAVTGSSGTAFLLVAANVPFGYIVQVGPGAGTATAAAISEGVVDMLPSSSLSEAMQSQYWYPPPTNMIGILPLPNEIYAGFFGNVLCFSAQGIPHAWPIIYQLSFDFPIVGLGNIDSTVVAATDNFPYLCSGNSPGSYSQTKASYPYACASKRSIQFIQNIGVVFATFEGLVSIAGPGMERVLTKDLFSKREWEALNPASMISAVSDNRYFCWYDATSIGGSKGGFYLDLQPQSPYPGIPSIVSGKVSLAFHAYARYNDPLSDNLYVVVDQCTYGLDFTLNTIVTFDADTLNPLPYLWHSKQFFVQWPTTFRYARVTANSYLNTTLNLFADGVQYASIAVSSEVEFALPYGMCFKYFEFEITGTDTVNRVQIVEDAEEFT